MDVQKIEELLKPSLKDNGYLLVDLIAFSRGSQKVLDIRLENKDLSPIALKDCQIANRLISTILDVEDFIAEKYTLEVGSVGENRPLKTPEDFKRFLGKKAKIETINLIDNRRRFKGELLKADEKIKIKTEDGIFEISFDNVEKAKLSNVSD
ncbi:MAG: ribosome maturation factor RimP [Alphaproteobacteria bacterium]|nr:MAG: hypothetical protein B6I23_01480 [Rickettsiaceae bacterium 4572_127]